MESDSFIDLNDLKGKWGMHYGASPKLFKLAEELRGRMTESEKILWNVLRKNDWQLNFRRQHPLSVYIADFYCHKIKLVIEIDGGYHENKEVKIYDKQREKDIQEYGIKVLRFKNEEVISNIESVLVKISNIIAAIQSAKMEEKLSNNHLLVSSEEADCSKTSPLGAGGNSMYLPSLFVIKIGGNVIDDDIALQSFLKDFASINEKKILVHGGGKIATKIGEQSGIKSNYVNGRRITDAATIDLVTMVYGGLVNKKIVAKLQSMQCNAIGLTGADANIIPATKRPVEEIDFGFVGDVTPAGIGVQNVQALLSNNFTLVFAPLTHDGNGQILNTNADTIASALAVALSKKYEIRLIYCFEKKGVLENVEDENSVITLITKGKYAQLVRDKKLFDGILPKIDNAFTAIDNGVKEVLIGDANDLLRNVTANTIGTLIK